MERRANSPFVSDVDLAHFLSDGDGGDETVAAVATPATPTPTAGAEHARLQQEDMDRLEDENQALRDENSKQALEISALRHSLNELQLVYRKRDNKDRRVMNVGRLLGWKK